MISMKSRRARSIIIFIALMLFFVFFGLLGFKINLPWQLADAKAQWTAQNIHDYRYRVQFGCFCSTGAAYITVLDGQVTRIEEDTTNPLTYPRPNPPKLTDISASPRWYANFTHTFPADLSQYAVEGLFDFVERHPPALMTACTDSKIYEITYNQERGYVDGVVFSDCPSWDIGLCLVAPRVGDCWIQLHISDFEALPNAE